MRAALDLPLLTQEDGGRVTDGRWLCVCLAVAGLFGAASWGLRLDEYFGTGDPCRHNRALTR